MIDLRSDVTPGRRVEQVKIWYRSTPANATFRSRAIERKHHLSDRHANSTQSKRRWTGHNSYVTQSAINCISDELQCDKRSKETACIMRTMNRRSLQAVLVMLVRWRRWTLSFERPSVDATLTTTYTVVGGPRRSSTSERLHSHTHTHTHTHQYNGY